MHPYSFSFDLVAADAFKSIGANLQKSCLRLAQFRFTRSGLLQEGSLSPEPRPAVAAIILRSALLLQFPRCWYLSSIGYSTYISGIEILYVEPAEATYVTQTDDDHHRRHPSTSTPQLLPMKESILVWFYVILKSRSIHILLILYYCTIFCYLKLHLRFSLVLKLRLIIKWLKEQYLNHCLISTVKVKWLEVIKIRFVNKFTFINFSTADIILSDNVNQRFYYRSFNRCNYNTLNLMVT